MKIGDIMSEKSAPFVIIGSGQLGQAVMEALTARDEEVTMVNRSGRRPPGVPEKVNVVAADATDADAVAHVCDGAKVVFHCAMPPYLEWAQKLPPLTRGILDGVAKTGARLVYGDNLYMYGPTGGRPIHEDLPYAAAGKKGRVRAAMARQLLEAHEAGRVPVTIGRASDFYGPGVTQAFLGEMFFRPALTGKPVNLFGDLDAPHTFHYVKDFGRALVTLSDHEEAFGHVWHVPADRTLSTRDMLALIEKEIGRPLKTRVAGRAMLSVIGLFNPMVRELKELLYSWEEPYIVDHSRFEQAFGAETTPHETAIRETVAWYRNHLGTN